MTDFNGQLENWIRAIPDFPKPGILFRDITPLLKEPAAFRHAITLLGKPWEGEKLDAIAGIESRGFIFGAALADRLGIPFVPIRKPGKLPYKTRKMSYALEYGEDTIEIHEDAVGSGDRVLIVDDLLATGGTMAAAIKLVESLGAKVEEALFVIELAGLDGRSKLGTAKVRSLLTY